MFARGCWSVAQDSSACGYITQNGDGGHGNLKVRHGRMLALN